MMTFRNIYEHSLGLLGEDLSGSYSEDYLLRAPYLLALLCCDLASYDNDYRETHGMKQLPHFDKPSVNLDEEFPLCNVFVPTAVFYLASMLIFDTDTPRSDNLYEKFCDSLVSLTGSMPFIKGHTVDKYPDQN